VFEGVCSLHLFIGTQIISRPYANNMLRKMSDLPGLMGKKGWEKVLIVKKFNNF